MKTRLWENKKTVVNCQRMPVIKEDEGKQERPEEKPEPGEAVPPPPASTEFSSFQPYGYV